jgi:chorismate mutase
MNEAAVFAMNSLSMRLATCREKIDSLDQRILQLAQDRARVVQQVVNIKREAHLPVTVPSRE